MTCPKAVFPVLAILAVFAAAKLTSHPAFADEPSTVQAERLAVSGAWVAHAPPSMTVHAAYLDIANQGSEDRTIVAVESPLYNRAELHISRIENDVAFMERLDQVGVPAGARVSFRPGGLHIMLIGPKGPVNLSDTVPIILAFADGEELKVDAPVSTGPDAGSGGHHGDHHQPGS